MSDPSLQSLVLQTLLVSGLHILLPSHWLPVVTVAHSRSWTLQTTVATALFAAGLHAISTLILGGILGSIAHWVPSIPAWIAPALLIAIGIYLVASDYLWPHKDHTPQNLNSTANAPFEKRYPAHRIGLSLSLAGTMFLAPCLEVQGFFFGAGAYHGIRGLFAVGLTYTVTTLLGLGTVVAIAYKGGALGKVKFGTAHAHLLGGILLIVFGLAWLWFGEV